MEGAQIEFSVGGDVDQVELKAKAQMLAELHLIKLLRFGERPVQASLNEEAARRSGGYFVANSTLTCPEGKLLVLGYLDYSGYSDGCQIGLRPLQD